MFNNVLRTFLPSQRLIVRKLVIPHYKLPGHLGLKSSREFTRAKLPGVSWSREEGSDRLDAF